MRVIKSVLSGLLISSSLCASIHLTNPFEDFFAKTRDSFFHGGPRIDISETKTSIVLALEVPGYEKDDIIISVAPDGRSVKVEGERRQTVEEQNDDLIYHKREISKQHFAITQSLACPVTEEGAVATIKNGILTIMLPKVEKNATCRLIPIHQE